MSNRFLSVLLGASALTSAALCAAPALAQDDAGALEEIVVTARRATENVQDIPVTVQAISGEKLQQQAITQFQEISKLSPGLQIQFAAGSKGTNAELILRGVKWSAGSGTPAIPTYLNELEVNPNYMVLSMFDVGQIEVLRGPQGTTRGAPSISGAITVSTRKPDLSEFGGYVQGLVGTRDHMNLQGAINFPIIPDKLAVRLSGATEDSRGNHVFSLNNALEPHVGQDGARVSVLWQPTDTVKVDLIYQYINYKTQTYDQLAGRGSAGFTVAAGSLPGQTPRVLPANYNGPVIGSGDYLALNDVRADMKNRADIWGLHTSWDVAGHTLSYMAGYEAVKFDGVNSQDPGGQLRGYDPVQLLIGPTEVIIHELRLASNPDPDRMIDYVVGAYYFRSKGKTYLYNTPSLLGGAFGAAGTTANPLSINQAAIERYRLTGFGNIGIQSENYSFYANATLHLGDKTELTGGVRSIHDHRKALSLIYTNNGFINLLPVGGSCVPLGATASAIYPGTCDRPVSPPTTISVGGQPQPNLSVYGTYDKTFTPIIWNASLSHKFTEDILAYATVGTSWRGGQNNVGIFTNSEDILFTTPEKATSYEIGVKTSWLDNRMRLNVSAFQIDYKGQITQFPSIQYWSTSSNSVTTGSSAFYQNVDSRVRGVEGEFAFEPIQNLTLGANAAYAEITSEGSLAPCNNPAVPITATNIMNFCALSKGKVLNSIPKFTASVNGQYVVPMNAFNGFVRFNLAHRGKNPNYGYVFEGKAHDIFDLFAGLRGKDGAWEVAAYAKNLFNEKVELNRTILTSNLLPAGASAQFGPPGYDFVTTTIPREIGVSVRYAFGSR